MEKITLYHTGFYEIRTPDLKRGRANADFGQGFYLTADMEFSQRWAKERSGRADKYKEADVIIGPVACDTIYDTWGVITSGQLTYEQALRLLMIGPEYEQTVIKTPAAAAHLTWVSSRILSPDEIGEYRRTVQTEQERYQELFAKELDRML